MIIYKRSQSGINVDQTQNMKHAEQSIRLCINYLLLKKRNFIEEGMLQKKIGEKVSYFSK